MRPDSLLHVMLITGAFACAVAATVQPQQRAAARNSDATPSLLIVGAKVLDPEGERWLDDRAVLVVDGHIKRIAPMGEIDSQAAGAAKRIDAAGQYLVPGLMDLHTHLLLHPYNEKVWDDQVLKESLESRTIRGVNAAKATLEAGFTTIRDLGTEGAGVADVALRDAINSGMIAGPRVLAVTRAIVATGCYGPSGFDPRVQQDLLQGAQEVTGIDEMRKAVREQIALGADWIKVYADYRRAPGSPATPTFTEEELRAAVDEARSAGRKVSAHATTDEGIRRAVQAGVATIEHGYGASRETMQLMKERGVALCPTMAAAEAVALYAGWRPEANGGADPRSKTPASVEQSRASLALAREVGVTIANGSDAGVFAHGENAWELELLVKAGMPPPQALAAATRVAAKTIGRDEDLGRVQEGFVADLVLLRADPLADISALRKVAVVIKGGAIACEK